MSDEKKKIVDLAEELRVSAQEIIEFLRNKGVKVASPSSKVDAQTSALVYEQYNLEKAESDSLRKKKAMDEKKRKGVATISAKTSDVKPAASKTKASPSLATVVAPKPATIAVAEPAPAVSAPQAVEVAVEAKPVVEAELVVEVKEEPRLEPQRQAESEVIEERAPVAPVQEPAPIAEVAPAIEPPALVETPEPAPAEVAPVESASAEPPPVEPAPDIAAQPSATETQETDETDEEDDEPSAQAIGSETDLQRQIREEQANLASRYGAPENKGGLKVLGEIEIVKKKRKRKKRFGQQEKDLNGAIAQSAAPEAKAQPAKAQPAPPKPSAAKVESAPQTFSTDGEKAPPPPPSNKQTPREKKLEKVEKHAQKKKKHDIDEKLVERKMRETMEEMTSSNEFASRSKIRKLRKREREEREERAAEQRAAESKIIKLTEFTSTHEFADLIGVAPKDVIAKCFKLGKFITINQRLDKETLELLALEFGKEIQFISEHEITDAFEQEENAPEDLRPRPPVVTIMGHVDHGKTSLLDYIRRSNVVAGEAGGITQHIGAYEVTLENGQQITFLDTPGHEAFTAMRARGAEVTDIVILVVAADDNVMPQTIEAINHAKAAGVPIVVAINKIDKPEANPDKIRSQLAEVGVTVEEWGGDAQCQEISAKKGIGVRELLDKVLAQAELMELKANYHPDKLSKGVVIEAELDKGKGIVATVLVQDGLLKVGDPFVCGASSGKVRAMLDERGRRLDVAHPSQPVRVLGFEALPEAGDIFAVTPSEKEARDIAQRRQLIRREQEFRQKSRARLNDISKQAQEGGVKELRLIIKADVGGSIEALADGLMKLQTSEVKLEIIHKGVGQITESDVLLAAASDAIIIGFRARPNLNAKKLAEREQIDIRYYTVIYHALEEIKDALEGMLAPEFVEEVTALVEIREVFRISKIGNVAGCMVLEGTLRRDSKVRLLRDGIQIYEGELASLKRFKDDVKEVEAGYECGLSLQGYDDIKIGDMIEAYQMVETKRKLVAEE